MLVCVNCATPLNTESRFCPYCGYSPEKEQPESIQLSVGSTLKDRYIVGMTLGSGSFGATYVGWDKQLERRVAVKEYLPSEFATRASGQTEVSIFKDEKKQKQFHDGHVKFMEEAEKLKKLPEDSGIVAIYDSFNENKTGYIIMEYLHGETLAQRLSRNKLSAAEAVNLALHITNAMRLAHSEGLVHGDICPENIFLTVDGRIKLIDFSAHRFATTSHSRSLSVVVKSGYSPEEQYRSRGDQGAHTDVYSLGAVLYRAVTGFAPPDALERRASYERKKKDIIKPVHAAGLKKAQATAIMNALNVMIEDRTPDMTAFGTELMSSSVKRRGNSIKRQILDLPRPVKIASLAGIILIGVSAALFALGIIKIGGGEQDIIPEGMNIVPSVIGMSEADAAGVLSAAEFQYIIGGTQYSAIIPKEFVLSQNISAGTFAPANTMLALTISGGPEMKEMPSVVGMDAEEVAQELENLGFTIKRDSRPNNILEAGKVISASVKAGDMYPVGETITLYISRGHDGLWPSYMADVPDLVGKSLEELIDSDVLEFRIEVTDRQYSQTVPEGQIISQSLTAGTREMSDEIIGVVLSLGRQMTKVPNLQYRTESEAREAAETLGLSIAVQYEESATVSAGLVISQSQAADSSVELGSNITIVVSLGKTVMMPNVAGETEANARKKLTAEGLIVSVDYDTSSTVPKGSVISQSPAAGSELRVGDGVTITVCSDKPPVTVPGVVGKERNIAKRELENAKFSVIINELYDDYVKKDNVIFQTPQSGTQQPEGSVIVLAVSLGPAPVDVPDFAPRGSSYTSQSNAEKILKELGLVTKVTGEYHDTVPLGMVISQSPQANSSLNKGSTVNLTVSLGMKTDYMPDLRGVSRASAEDTLYRMDMNLTISIQEEYSTVKKGNVSSHSPGVGVLLKQNDWVTLYISRGPQPQPIPDVYDMTESQAINTLRNSGFIVSTTRVYDKYIEKGRVVSQFPAAGVRAEENTTVTITVSDGIPTVWVPDVRNYSEASAQSVLTHNDYGFTVSINHEQSTTVPIGDVISQSPSGGSNVLWGSAVSITVSTGPGNVNIPNVVGSTESSAISALNSAGFTVNVNKTASDTVTKDYVISQSPAANTSVAPGSTVTINVSTGPANVPVPNVVNETQINAVNTLESSGFISLINSAASESVPQGSVISQSPAANTSAPKGSIVTITVSTGPGNVNVPHVIGETKETARTILEGLGFVVSEIPQSHLVDAVGIVFLQNPVSGTSAAKGSTVTITVSTGPADVIVSNVVGEIQAFASVKLEGLTIKFVETPSATITKGTIISQSLPAGTSVKSGTEITITVSTGLPNVVGLTFVEAKTKLEALGLTVIYKEELSSTVEVGKIISQNPIAGSTVATGSKDITLTISMGPAP